MKLKFLIIVFLLFIISLIITLNLFFHQSYETEMAAQINRQQLIIADTLAKNLGDSFEHFEEELVSFSALLSYRGLQKEGIEEFVRHALAESQEEVGIDLYVLDPSDRLVFSSGEPYQVSDDERLLIDVAKRSAPTEPYLIDSSTRDGRIKMAASVKLDGGLLGTVLMFVHVDDVIDRYITHREHDRRGYAWVMDVYGTLVYHPAQPSMIGENVFTSEDYCFSCHVSFEIERTILKTAGEGVQTYVAPRGEDKLLAFSHTKVPEWIVIVSMPYSEVTASIKNSMKLQSVLVLSIFIMTVLSAFVIIIINRQRIRAEARATYVDKVRDYANELENIVNERTRELTSEKEKLDAIIASMEAGIGIFDEDGTCVWMNQVLEGWLSDEQKGRFTLESFFDSAEIGENRHGAVVEDDSIMEVTQLDLGNKKGYFHITVTRVHSPLGGWQIMLFVQDVTELKMAEEKLIQSDKLAALSRLSAGVAHEIGNPLTSISSYVQILDGMEEKDEFTSKTLNVISKNISRIVSIVKQMASFTKSQKQELRHFAIPELLDSTIELVRYDRRTKGIDIKMNVSDDLNAVRVDGNQMVQIFINLVLNAVDSMEEGGVLEIQAGNDENKVVIYFRDTGHGIAPEYLERIFEPFFTTKDGGTGFGLSVSYSIIKSFGGDIEVESTPGKGTTFTVRLPAYEREHVPVDGS
jgi:C4-dicarboxylate-specific signal transduction histidine kinase